MYDTIVVPLDGSPFAEQVLPLAATVARKCGMALDLVKVHRTYRPGYGQETMLAAFELEGRDRAFSADYLRRTASRIADENAIRVTHRLVDDPSPYAEAICGEAVRVNASMIAMTTHGRTGLLRTMRGSVADGVLRHTTLPVLLWRPVEGEPPALMLSPTHILVPLDGSTWAEMVLPAAVALASVLGARLTLLKVVAPVVAMVPAAAAMLGELPYVGTGSAAPMIDDDATRRAVERAQGYLEHVLDRVRFEHPELVVAGHVFTDDHASAAILRMARDVGAEIVAMTTHGRGTSRLIVGSTVDRVLAGRTGATLVVRPTVPIPRA
jgi:nucleotide-binding universal stress UspA family protein